MVDLQIESSWPCTPDGARFRMQLATPDQWQQLVERSADSTPLHCPCWLRLIEQSYDMRLRIVTLFDGVIRDLAERRVGRFDFGAMEATNGGIRHFKKKWGTMEIPVATQHILSVPRRDGRLHARKLIRGAIGNVIRIAPMRFGRWCGDLLAKYSAGNAW